MAKEKIKKRVVRLDTPLSAKVHFHSEDGKLVQKTTFYEDRLPSESMQRRLLMKTPRGNRLALTPKSFHITLVLPYTWGTFNAETIANDEIDRMFHYIYDHEQLVKQTMEELQA